MRAPSACSGCSQAMRRLTRTRRSCIRFLAVLPIQLIEGTKISVLASSSYAAWQGISPREYMSRFEVPLDAQKVAAAIVGGLRGDVAAGVTAIAVSGKGVEPLG